MSQALIGYGDNTFGDIVINSEILFSDWEITQNDDDDLEINNNGVNILTLTSSGLLIDSIRDDDQDTYIHVEENVDEDIIRFYTNGNERMTIASNGDIAMDTDTLFIDNSTNRVGIGLTTPLSVLHIFDSSPVIWIEDGTNGFLLSQETDGEIDFHNFSNSGNIAYSFRDSGGNSKLIMNDGDGSSVEVPTGDLLITDGNVGIGTTTPEELLHILRDGDNDTSMKIENTNSGTNAETRLQMINDNSDSAFLRLFSSGYTTNNAEIQDGLLIQTANNMAGGITLTSLTGGINFFTGGSNTSNTNERMVIEDGGDITMNGVLSTQNPYRQMNKTNSQNLPNGSDVTLLYNNTNLNQGDIGYSSGTFTINTPGLYHISYTTAFSGNNSGLRYCYILRSGSRVAQTRFSVVDTAYTAANGTAILNLDDGDTFTIVAHQNSGSTLTTGSGGLQTNYVHIYRLDGLVS